MAEELEWYALEVIRQKEYVAGFLLKRQFACETFIPTTTRWRRRSRYARAKTEFAHAAIPGVIFAGFAGPPAWYHLMRLQHITGVLSIGERPATINAKELSAFRATQLDGHLVIERVRVCYRGGEMERSRRSIFVEGRGILRAPEEQRHMRSKKEFATGDDVRVAEGPFRDNNVRVNQITGTRAKVLLPLFGGVEATIELDELEAIR